MSVSVTSECPQEACGFCCGCFRLSVVPPSVALLAPETLKAPSSFSEYLAKRLGQKRHHSLPGTCLLLCRVRTPEFRDFPRPHSQEGGQVSPASVGPPKVAGAGCPGSFLVILALHTPRLCLGEIAKSKQQDSPTRAVPLYTATGTPDMFNKSLCVNSKTKQSKNQPTRFLLVSTRCYCFRNRE